MEIWEGLGLSEFITAFIRMDRSLSMLLEELLCSSTPGGVPHNIAFFGKTIMITCWYLWWSRRQIKNKEPVPSPERSIMNIHEIIANYVEVRGSGNIVRRGRWTRSAAGVYKLNVDTAFDIDSGCGASEAIIRDTGGNFVVACYDFTDHAIDVMDMEAAALLAGLKLAEQFGAQSLLVESDSMEVVNVVHNPSEFRGTSAVVIDDCRHLLMMLGTATLKHCWREANGAAHARLLSMVRLIVLRGVFGLMNLLLFLFLFL
jgi:hypothetical protein